MLCFIFQYKYGGSQKWVGPGQIQAAQVEYLVIAQSKLLFHEKAGKFLVLFKPVMHWSR